MQSAETAARGTIELTIIAIITDMQDLNEIADVGEQRPDLHTAGVDAVGAEPDHRHGGQVHDEHDHGEHHRHEVANAERGVRQLVVGRPEAGPLAILADEGAHDADAGDLFAQHPVHRVEAGLHLPEERDHAPDDDGDDGDEDRHGDRNQPGQADVLAHRHDDAADHRDRGADQDDRRHDEELLELLDVVRVAGDEAGGAEAGELAAGERHGASEERFPQVTPHRQRRPGAHPGGADAARHVEEARTEHPDRGAPDVADVAPGHAVVDDVSVEARQGQRRHVAGELQNAQRQQEAGVRPQVGPQETGQHGAGLSDGSRSCDVLLCSGTPPGAGLPACADHRVKKNTLTSRGIVPR